MAISRKAELPRYGNVANQRKNGLGHLVKRFLIS